jgi:Type I phosphodiesterase / nucleotide pyrophosphatase
MGSPEASSVQKVREELKRLGYLDTGLDRFVLGGAGGSSPLRTSLAAAARVGLVGGALFAAVLTLAAAVIDRRLLTAPGDLALLALYLLVALGAVIAASAFACGMAAGWAGRRLGRRPGPALTRNIGVGLGSAALVYCALWWRTHVPGARAPLHALAAVLALALALALGRFGSLAAVAVLSAGGVGDRLPRASLSRRRMLPLLALAALLIGGGVAAAAYFGGEAGPAVPDFAVLPTGLRIRVLGIDGLDARMAEQMIGRGEMSHLQQLLVSGARGRLRPEPEEVPAIVWTTIATGRGPESHGVRSPGARRLAGMRTPVAVPEDGGISRGLAAATDLLRLTRPQPPTALLRGAKTFWNVASDKGLRVGIVNWWATWPAEAVNGYVVSDRAFFKLERGEPFDRETHPPSVFDRLRPLLAERDDDRARRLDRFHLAAALALRREQPADVEALYLSGLDIATTQRLGDSAVLDLASLDARVAAVREQYRFSDELIGRFIEDLGSGDLLVLVGDPGRHARRSTPPPEGLIVLRGPAAATVDLGAVSERDVAPTVLHLAGLPVSRELEGRVLEAALSSGFRAAHPVRSVASYGRRPAAPTAESAFDREILEELRSLGYIR